MTDTPQYRTQPNWKQVGIFLVLTFGLTYLLDLVLYLSVGYKLSSGTLMILQGQMLIPAFVAIVLQLFAFRDSPIYRLRERPRWFFYFFLVYALLHTAMTVSVILVSNTLFQTAISLVSLGLNAGGLLFLVVLRLIAGRDAFQRAGLTGGKAWYYVAFGLFFIALYAVMIGLNALFNLGQPVDVMAMLEQAAPGQTSGLEQLPVALIVVISGVQSILLAPFLGLLMAFGEEYGWRGYLQGELVKLGKVPGIALVGLIWGLWHAPVILMGHNYPGYPLPGVLLMTLYTIALAFILGFVVLKSGSVWLAAYLHALNNGVITFLYAMVHRPNDPVFSFGVGLYGLLVFALVVGMLLILGRKEWKTPVALPEAAHAEVS